MERRWVSVALGLVAGLLICASLPPWGWWPLAPVGIALWIWLLGNPSRLQRFLVSWAVGVAWFGPSTLWMWGLTQPGYVIGVLLAWGPMVGCIGLASPGDRRRLLAVPAGIVLFEWFHTHAPFGGVPLSMLAMTQTRAPMLPVAVVGGALVLSGAVAVLGVAIFSAVAERRWREPVALVIGCALLTGAGVLWPTGPTGKGPDDVRFAVVQGGGPQGTRYESGEAPLVYERHLEATRTLEPDDDLDVVLWPENAINVDGAFADSSWGPELAAEAVRLDATLIVGIVEDSPDDPDAFLNYVLVYGPDGTVQDRYDKERRVPFGEYVPLRFLFEPIAGAALPSRDQVPGIGSAAVETGSGKMAVAISWEIFFGRRVREGVRDGGEIVLNPTNGSSYWLTQVQSQQLATSALRAAESGRWVLQAAPTGFSAVFDQHGRVLQRTGVSERKVLIADVPRLTRTTPAQALGDLPALLVCAMTVLVVGLPWIRRRRSGGDVGGDHATETVDHTG